MTDHFFHHSSSRRSLLGICILATLLFFAYAAFSFGAPHKFNSPDETANYFFSSRVAAGTSMSQPVSVSLAAPGLIAPRNTWIQHDRLVPASFPGLPDFYGVIGRITTPSVLLYLTPFFTSVAITYPATKRCKNNRKRNSGSNQ